ncbi:MAG: sulfoxide reductase heme-binding subunit YedZ [Acidobacteria bacterium]|nr:sulfoxide reductase heme-binding subunit YedZ [Acidobacteriota bacterium]
MDTPTRWRNFTPGWISKSIIRKRSLPVRSLFTIKRLKIVIFLLSLGPLAYLVWGVFHDNLGPNPIEKITHETGDWILIFLMLTLSITPLRKITHLQSLIRFRRMLGLFAFFYACLHFTTYIWLDKFFDFPEMVKDVGMRPFITAGFTAFVLLIPLAVTSTAGWIRRLGGKRWQMLHRLIYISAAAGVVHYLWLVKSDIRKPLQYGTVLLVLLSYRLVSGLVENLRKKKAPEKTRSELVMLLPQKTLPRTTKEIGSLPPSNSLSEP